MVGSRGSLKHTCAGIAMLDRLPSSPNAPSRRLGFAQSILYPCPRAWIRQLREESGKAVSGSADQIVTAHLLDPRLKKTARRSIAAQGRVPNKLLWGPLSVFTPIIRSSNGSRTFLCMVA